METLIIPVPVHAGKKVNDTELQNHFSVQAYLNSKKCLSV